MPGDLLVRLRARSTLLALVFSAATLLRVHDAWVAPPLSGYDGPFHAAYAGILFFEGRLPAPDESFSTFHPPLYYALLAGVWRLLPAGLSPHAVLFALRLVNVAAGLSIGVVVWRIAGILAPASRALPLYAATLALFLPMHVIASALLGNEIASAALCTLALLLLLRALARPPSLARSAALGLVLGLAALTKLSALTLLAASVGTLAWQAVRTHRPRAAALRAPLVVGACFLLVAGWLYVRNLRGFGTPFPVQNAILTAVIEREGYGPPRPLRSYLDLRPAVLLDPADRSPAATQPVWPLTFATTWFDTHGTLVDVHHPRAKRFARILFACGAVFTTLAGLGALRVVSGRAGLAVPFAGVALLAVAGISIAAYLFLTHRLAVPSALKGAYLSPAAAAFVLLAALGVERAARAGAAARLAVHAALALLVVAVCSIFWAGGLAPMRANPADFYLRAHSDPATRRVYDYFVRGIAPSPRDGAGAPGRPPRPSD